MFMRKLTIKNLIILSIFLHLSVFLSTFFTTSIERKTKQQFIILGAHSQIPTQALFKLNTQTKQTDWHAKRVTEIKEQQEARASKRRAQIAREKKIIEQRKKVAAAKQAKEAMLKKQTSIEKEAKKEPPRKIKNKIDTKEQNSKLASNKETLDIDGNKNVTKDKLSEVSETISPDMIYNKETYNQELQAEVRQYWTLSKDIDKGTRAIATFKIDKHGQIKDFHLKEKSGILLYDISIRHAFLKMKISEKFWNREYDLEFIQ